MERKIDKDTFLCVVRNYRGTEGINYLMTVCDFKKKFGEKTRTDFFSTHDQNTDWQIFIDTLSKKQCAEWANFNNDTMTVWVLTDDNIYSFLNGGLNDDPTELILLNMDTRESIVDVITLYTDVCSWHLDISESSPVVVEYARKKYSDLVNDSYRGLYFEEAFEEIKDVLTDEQVAECEDYIRKMKKEMSVMVS